MNIANKTRNRLKIPIMENNILKKIAVQFPHVSLQKQLLVLSMVIKLPNPPQSIFNIANGKIAKPSYSLGRRSYIFIFNRAHV